jgi:hypothetical protein
VHLSETSVRAVVGALTLYSHKYFIHTNKHTNKHTHTYTHIHTHTHTYTHTHTVTLFSWNLVAASGDACGGDGEGDGNGDGNSDSKNLGQSHITLF